jgi:simple sugar transport system permease protein
VSDDKPTGEERFDEEARIEAEEEALEQETPEAVGGGDYAPSVAARVSAFQRAGGAVIPIVTTIFALLMGMVVVAATGHNPLTAFKGIFDGTGLNWLFPWVQGQARTDAAFNLQQTLIVTSTLILAGFAVSFAFKCGMFNIGGNGQYIMGALVSVWIASSWVDMNGSLHIFLAITLATVVGALWAGIAGFLKATVGVHEVISTIMLNFIASYFAQGLVGRGGQLQNTVDTSNPVSSDIAPKTHLPVFWGDPILQGLHVGFFIALGAPIVFWLVLYRTTLGFEVRATGFNPEAARYGGVSVRKSYILAMAISGAFAGLAGAIDILGWQFRLGVLDIQIANIGFIGIAVALLGRNSAIGVPLAALFFGALVQGTSTRNPAIQDVFDPRLAGNLSTIIQGLVLLFVGMDLLFIWLWNQRRRARHAATGAAQQPQGATR